MNHWIVGKHCEIFGWHFQGIFDCEQKAVDACVTDQYFVGPCRMNETLPDEPTEWEGVYYPLCEPL